MALVAVQHGQSRRLPTTHILTIGLTWQDKLGRPAADLDLWIVRMHASGLAEVVSWAKQDWHRPDLGRDSNDSPHVATPEQDVIYFSDRPDMQAGFRKTARVNLDRTPHGVTGYGVFAAVYDPDFRGHTLGSVKDVTLGVADPANRNQLITQPLNYPWARSLAIASIKRDTPPQGSWYMQTVTADKCASVETMHQVCTRFNAS